MVARLRVSKRAVLGSYGLVSRRGRALALKEVSLLLLEWRDVVLRPSGISQAHIHESLLEAGTREGGSGEVGILKVGPIKADSLEVGSHEAGIPLQLHL